MKNNPIINRDISWLSFNDRVLQEAEDANNPLIERLKFLGIFSNNLDEFFRVRVGTYKRMIELGKNSKYAISGIHPAKVLEEIKKKAIVQQEKFESVYASILKELNKNKIYIVNEKELNREQGTEVKRYFDDEVRPLLVPIMIESAPKFPYLKDDKIYLAVKLSKKSSKTRFNYALIEVPTEISRFYILSDKSKGTFIMLIDDIIRYCLKEIFAVFEFDTFGAYTIKITRDAEIDIDSDFSKSIAEKISRGLKLRKVGDLVRMVYDNQIPKDILDFILKRMGTQKHQTLVPGGRYHNFKDFMKFPKVMGEQFYNPYQEPTDCKAFVKNKSLIDILKKEDVLLCYPYQSFDHVIDFLREAAIDPNVNSIKITLYRAAKRSKIVNALINALRNGKNVTVVIEIQARFDEQANLNLANLLQEEGARVIYGVQGLKVHSKLIQVTRKEGNRLVNYAHIGTGNFNEDTALVYSDYSLFTSDIRITNELDKVFQFYKNNFKIGIYKHLMVAPFFMRNKIEKLIQAEIKNAKAGFPASIAFKLNSLVDEELINKLYSASKAGVKIRLIIRGICSLVPGIKGLSDNIEAISLVDKYLEHSRVLMFHANGEEKIYISSADLMVRNLDFRSEVGCPVYHPKLKKVLKDFFEIQWRGNTKVRILDKALSNNYRLPEKGKTRVRAQDELYSYFSKLK
jgi:polyphosphate kinase